MSRLELVKKGKLSTPKKLFIYGGAGLGKTTLAADAPDVVFVDADAGSENLEVARYPFTDDPITGHVPTTYKQILDCLDDLYASQHAYKTVVFDTADKIESLMHAYMCERDSTRSGGRNQDKQKLESIEDYGWGKGFNLAVDELRLLLHKLDLLRSKGITIVILAHSQVKPFKNPLGADFDKFIPKVNEKFFGVIKEWADLTGFLTLDGGVSKDLVGGNDKRYRGFSTGARILHTSPNAAFEAKTRLMLPASIEIPQVNPWSVIAKAISDSDGVSVDELCERIAKQFERFEKDSKFRVKGEEAVKVAKDAGNRDQLIKILKYVEETKVEKESDNA